jgi:hypothetical protein
MYVEQLGEYLLVEIELLGENLRRFCFFCLE